MDMLYFYTPLPVFRTSPHIPEVPEGKGMVKVKNMGAQVVSTLFKQNQPQFEQTF